MWVTKLIKVKKGSEIVAVLYVSLISAHVWCFVGDEAAVWQVEHRAEGLSSGATSAQPFARLHEPFTEGSGGADGNGEAGRLGRLPGPGALPV